MSDDDSPVGYRRPPIHSRFKKGQSGNPSGRPKGSRSLLALIERELKRMVTVQRGGRSRRITAAEAVATRLVHRAIAGDANAIRQLIGLPAAADRLAAAPAQLSEADLQLAEAFRASLDRKEEP